MVNHHAIHTSHVFLTRLSSRAAMTNVMLATFPEVSPLELELPGCLFKCAT
jgi:hypothetical protein